MWMGLRREKRARCQRAEIVAVLPAILRHNNFAAHFLGVVLAAWRTKQRFDFLLGHAGVHLAPIVLVLGFTALRATQRRQECKCNGALTKPCCIKKVRGRARRS